MRRFLSLIVSIICVFAVVKAQSIVVEGKIVDNSGLALDMVHIRLSKGTIGTLSNFKGEYELRVHEADSLQIIFTRIGYKRIERTVFIDKDKKNIRLDIQMLPNEAVLNDIEITAAQRNTSTLEKIDAKVFSNQISASGNIVEDMLGTMAGVTMNNELSSQYSVRGGSFDENLVYVNGIEIYRPQLISSAQQEGLSFVNSSMISSIGFSTGGFAAEYGDKMSSVLDITYRKPKAFEAEANIDLLGTSATIGSSNKNFSQLHGIRYRRNNSLLSSLDTKGEYDPRFFDYQTFIKYDISPVTEISFLGNIATNHYKFEPASRETSFGTLSDIRKFKVYFDGKERDRFDTWFGALALSYKGIKGTSLQMTASAFSTREQITYDITGEYWLGEAVDEGQSSLGVGSYHEHARNALHASVIDFSVKGTTQIKHHKLSYGLSARSQTISDRIAEWEMHDSSGYVLPHLDDKVLMTSNQHSSWQNTATRLSAFLQENYGWDGLNGRFYLIAGVRVSYSSFNHETLISPRASLQYTPQSKPGLTLRLASGIYSQTPFYKELRATSTDSDGNTIVTMNRNIKSQKSLHIVASADYNFKAYNRPFKFTAEAYYKHIGDYIPYTVDNVQIRYLGKNNGKAYGAGLDMKLFGEFVEGTDSWISFSLMQAKETYDGLTTSRPTEQRYSLGLFFSDYWPGNNNYKVFVKGVFNDGLPFYSPLGGRKSGIFRTAAYKRLDLGAQRVFTAQNCNFMNRGKWRNIKEMSIGIDIFNIVDFDNINSYYWVTAIDNMQYAVPNYLTRRTFSLSFGIKL